MFFRHGFIRESAEILQAFPTVSMVGLRGRCGRQVFAKLPTERLDDVEFFRSRSNMLGDHHGYSYNPGLRRLSDWRRLGPFARIGVEGEVSWLAKMLGYVTAHLENPAVRHLGEERHVVDKRTPKKSRILMVARNWKRSRGSA